MRNRIAALLIAFFGFAAPAAAQTVRYNQTNFNAGLSSAPGVASLQVLTLTGTGREALSQLVVAAVQASNTPAQTVYGAFTFYGNVDPTRNSADALFGATNLGSFSRAITVTAAGASPVFRQAAFSNLDTALPMQIVLPAGTQVGYSYALYADAGLTTRSTVFSDAFGNTNTLVGTTNGNAYIDSGNDGLFAAADQSTTGQRTFVRISTVAAAPAAPEPAAWGLLILGFGAVGGLSRTRRRARVLA